MESLKSLVFPAVLASALVGLLLGLPNAMADKPAGRLYYQEFMGHLHREPSDSSASLTALQCAHPVQLIESDAVRTPSGWRYAKVGEDKGFVRERFLGEKRPDCFQEKYPKFYNNLNLDLTDFYYWGRLSDHFIEGESLPR